MFSYHFRVGDPANPYVFEARLDDTGASWTGVEVTVRGRATGKGKGVGDDIESAVLDAIEGILPADAADPAFMEEAGRQFSLQLVSVSA